MNIAEENPVSCKKVSPKETPKEAVTQLAFYINL